MTPEQANNQPQNPGRRVFLWSLFSAMVLACSGMVKWLLTLAAPPTTAVMDACELNTAASSHPAANISSAKVAFQPGVRYINDASKLDCTPIYGITKISSSDDIQNALQFARDNRLKVTAAGQRHSMGGQAFSKNGVVIDMRGLNRITVDKQAMTATVQSGATWAEVQQALDRDGLSVKAMQSINIFTVGGSLSVNAHGIAHQPGPISSTVQSLRIMLSNGTTVTASPTENMELFRNVLGGYGLMGVVLDVTLNVVPNEVYDRTIAYVDYKDFTQFYLDAVESKPEVGLFYGRLSVSPFTYLRKAEAYVYTHTPYAGTIPALSTENHDSIDRLVINLSKTGGFGRFVRWSLERRVEPSMHTCLTRSQILTPKEPCIVSRNQEMYDSMGYLKNALHDTDILQEYFIPFTYMVEFVDALRSIVQHTGANLLNVTIRIVHKDLISALPYAKADMFAFVLYFNQKTTTEESVVLARATRELIDAALMLGGTFYLPYRLVYSREQLMHAYPEIDAFFASKRKFDPDGLFSNAFYEKYGA